MRAMICLIAQSQQKTTLPTLKPLLIKRLERQSEAYRLYKSAQEIAEQCLKLANAADQEGAARAIGAYGRARASEKQALKLLTEARREVAHQAAVVDAILNTREWIKELLGNS